MEELGLAVQSSIHPLYSTVHHLPPPHPSFNLHCDPPMSPTHPPLQGTTTPTATKSA